MTNGFIRYALRLHLHGMQAESPTPLKLIFAYPLAGIIASIADFTDAGRATLQFFVLTADAMYPITCSAILVWAVVLIKQRIRQGETSMLALPSLAAVTSDVLKI